MASAVLAFGIVVALILVIYLFSFQLPGDDEGGLAAVGVIDARACHMDQERDRLVRISDALLG